MGTRNKVLWQTKLTDLDTTDVNGLGNLREDENGNVYRYVRNDAATALVAAGVCLTKFTSVVADIDHVVYSPDAATGPATALVHMPAGVPVTGIGATGTATGSFGWIQVAGIRKVSIMQSATAVLHEPGCMAISTSVQPATAPWDKPYTGTIDSTAGGTVNLKCISIASRLATTGVATAASAIAYIRCLT